MTITLTLGDIRAQGLSPAAWTKLLTALGQATTPDLTLRIGLGDVLAANGIYDTLWCLRCVSDPRERVSVVLPAVKRASRHTADQRVHDCLADIERWLAGDDGVDLQTAAAEARAAADAAAEARAVADAADARAEERALQAADIRRLSPALHINEVAE